MTARAAPARRPAAARRAALALLILLAAGSGPAAAQPFGKNKVQTRDLRWSVLTTPHFEIHHYEGTEELAVRASLIAERAYREYADRLDHELVGRVPFILYASHDDFAQTNIADELIGEGIGGFAEPFRNRMVLPYNGSHEDFEHVIRHELVHVFMFDAAFGSSRAATARSPFFRIPLWYAEGVAEWLSSGWDANADMFMRDATINDYLWPLDRAGGYLVYKQGQAAMRMIAQEYGEEKIVELWRRVARARSVETAVLQVLGLDREALDEQYRRWLRRRYWPGYAELEQPGDIARAYTDHARGNGSFNQRPAITPDGELIAFFSDRDGLTSIYLMSALDGKVLRRLVQGQRSSRFESLHSFRSGMSFAPDGRELAFIAKSGNERVLMTADVRGGRITRAWPLGLDAAFSPAWSPDGRRIALVGMQRGRTDLYLVDLDGGDGAGLAAVIGTAAPLPDGATLLRLTDDVGDEGPPAWTPDGRRLAFAFDRRAEIDFEFAVAPDGQRRLLWARPRAAAEPEGAAPRGGVVVLLQLASGQRTQPFGDEGGRRDPVWIDDGTLCLVDESEGVANLALVELDADGRAVAGSRRLTNVLGGLFQPAYAPAADRLIFTGFNAAGYDLYGVERFRAAWSRREPAGAPPPADVAPPAPLVLRRAAPDTVADRERIGLISAYRPRLTIDPTGPFGGGGVYYNSAVGLGLANVITLSDLMGDRRLQILLNFYGSVDNSDLAASYFQLRRRVNLGAGVFHFKNYYNSVITTVGELLPDNSFFSERNYGLFGLASYPLDTFRRFDLELQLFRSERTLYGRDASGYYLVETDRRTDSLAQPTLSYVHDTAFYGPFGPATGSRLAVSYAPTLPLGGDSLDRRTATVDLRRYWLPFRRNTIALRLVGAVSEGDDPRTFVLGGPFTLRGYRFYDYQTIDNLSGSRLLMANLEYRLPVIDYLIFGWPGRWGLSGIGGTLFCDVGAAWDGALRLTGEDAAGDWGLLDLRASYGLGLRTRLLMLPLKFDWAWKTDLRRSEGVVFHFSIGPEF